MVEFSITFIMNEVYEEDSEQNSIWTISSEEYKMIPHEGFVDFFALGGGDHTWRVHFKKNKWGRYMAEFKRGDSEIFETGFAVL